MNLVLALDILGAVVALMLVSVGALAFRRRLLTRRGGTFDCGLRLRPAAMGRGWVMGIGRYAGDTLEWYRVFSYATRPRVKLERRELEVLGRREPDGPEVFALLSGAVVVECAHGEGNVELAMGPGALTGFLSWLESMPPGEPA